MLTIEDEIVINASTHPPAGDPTCLDRLELTADAGDIKRDFERDKWMHAVDARTSGRIDEILGSTADVVLRRAQDELELAG